MATLDDRKGNHSKDTRNYPATAAKYLYQISRLSGQQMLRHYALGQSDYSSFCNSFCSISLEWMKSMAPHFNLFLFLTCRCRNAKTSTESFFVFFPRNFIIDGKILFKGAMKFDFSQSKILNTIYEIN